MDVEMKKQTQLVKDNKRPYVNDWSWRHSLLLQVCLELNVRVQTDCLNKGWGFKACKLQKHQKIFYSSYFYPYILLLYCLP